MSEAILSHPRLALQRKIAIVKAIGKVIWIQNDLLAKWQTVDGQAYLGDGEESQQSSVEPEGYLHGKQVLGDEHSMCSDGSGQTSSGKSSSGKSSIGRPLQHSDSEEETPLSCPFSGMRITSPGAGLDDQRSAPPSRPPSGTKAAESCRPSAIPKLHVSEGKVVGSGVVDRSLLK